MFAFGSPRVCMYTNPNWLCMDGRFRYTSKDFDVCETLDDVANTLTDLTSKVRVFEVKRIGADYLKAEREISARELFPPWLGPRRVGGRYLCGYWRQAYTVKSLNRKLLDRSGVYTTVTVVWEDGSETTHCTAWDSLRDKVLG